MFYVGVMTPYLIVARKFSLQGLNREELFGGFRKMARSHLKVRGAMRLRATRLTGALPNSRRDFRSHRIGKIEDLNRRCTAAVLNEGTSPRRPEVGGRCYQEDG
jgi:hypothetical protein